MFSSSARWPVIVLALLPSALSILITFVLGFTQVNYNFQPSLGHQVVFFVALVPLLGLSLLPTTFASLLAGYLFGFSSLVGLVVTYGAAIVLSFVAARVSFFNFVALPMQQDPRAQALKLNLEKTIFRTIVLMRLSPVFPFGVSNFLLSWLGVPLASVLAPSMLGMLPRTALALLMGQGAKSLLDAISSKSSASSTQLYIAVLVVGILATILLFMQFRSFFVGTKR